jgi:hypothetical protein
MREIEDFEESCIDMEETYNSDPAVGERICFSVDVLRLLNLIRHGFVDTSFFISITELNVRY